MHCPDVTLRSIRSHLSHVASLSIYNIFFILFYVRFYHYMCIHFSFSTVTCTCFARYTKYQSINHIERVQALDDISRSALYAFAVCKATMCTYVCVVIATKPVHRLQIRPPVHN